MKANWNNQIGESFVYLQIKSKTRLKSWIWGLNFVSDMAQVGEAKYIASFNNFSSNYSIEYLPWEIFFVMNTGYTVHLNRMAKIWFEGAHATYLVTNISLLYTNTVVRENA